jgi:hypothetical protein
MLIFWDITALRGWVAIGADAVNAFSQSTPPSEPTYVFINAQMREWLKEQNNIMVDQGDVHQVQYALQGHPQSGSIWADKVEAYPKNNLNFYYPVHELCLYIGSYGG